MVLFSRATMPGSWLSIAECNEGPMPMPMPMPIPSQALRANSERQSSHQPDVSKASAVGVVNVYRRRGWSA